MCHIIFNRNIFEDKPLQKGYYHPSSPHRLNTIHNNYQVDNWYIVLRTMRRVRRGSFSSVLLMCGGVRSILLLPLVAIDNRCMYMAQVCCYVCCSDCAVVC